MSDEGCWNSTDLIAARQDLQSAIRCAKGVPAGVDLLTIGRLLGHKSFSTTMIYLHVRRPHMESTPSPLDWLPVRQLPAWLQPPNRDKSNDQSNP